MRPTEFEEYINEIYANVPELKDVVLSVECSDEMNMGVACAISSVNVGAAQIKTAVGVNSCPSLKAVANVFRVKENVLGIKTNMNIAVLDNVAGRIASMATGGIHRVGSEFDKSHIDYSNDVKFSGEDDLKTIEKAIIDMGYELSAEDVKNVYDEFLKTASKKLVGIRELDAIIASTALQVVPTFKVKSYVINSGNVMTPTANIELIRDGEIQRGFCIGDGPIDAAFRAIEQISGLHYELDDFQIQSVTRGREALGESVVKLRANGKLYSGKGTSTDIVGACVNAYINALNKIFFEEGM
jgi:2-isopropylmalate synthase